MRVIQAPAHIRFNQEDPVMSQAYGPCAARAQTKVFSLLTGVHWRVYAHVKMQF